MKSHPVTMRLIGLRCSGAFNRPHRWALASDVFERLLREQPIYDGSYPQLTGSRLLDEPFEVWPELPAGHVWRLPR